MVAHPRVRHPHLALHAHPTCQSQIRALHACHERHPLRKFVGVCNATRRELDACLGEEFEAQRLANAERSKRRNERITTQQ